MTVRERIPFSELTTFKTGGPARYLADCESENDVREALAFARARRLPYVVIGDGSNLLASDEGYEGVVIRMRIGGISFSPKDADAVLMEAGAGVPWETAVEEAALRGLWGIENMAGIPGTVGAAPVQNIGAYGTELETSFVYADVLDADTDTVARLAKEDCGFGYRESRFKRERNLIILSVALLLSPTGAPQTSYSDLARLYEAGEPLATPGEIGNAVRRVRAGKFPDLRQSGTAGSFFKNPIVSEDAYAALVVRYGDIPRYPAAGGVKIPLAFVLDRALGLKGHRQGAVHLFGNQPLVIVADDDARTRDIDALANEIAKRVHDATGIAIEREVRSIP
ncbi:MAG TPA: UDP-N-acetylmuramate dehydrogenase [Candidatus Paceibacterota bacterium]|nr:UDP-N-acetylmuramate dehydrogenase [Candidatus Paceibacterota bacterium]